MGVKEKIVDKVRKLLALSTSNNVHEAASAAAAAQRLMQEHKLSATEISTEDNLDDMYELPVGAAGFTAIWKFELVTVVARAFFCEALGLRVGKSRKVKIIGVKEDAETASKVFSYLCREINRLARREINLLIMMSSLERRSVRRAIDSFRRGAVHAVARSFQAERRKFDGSGEKALVISKRSKDKIFTHIHAKYESTRRPIASPRRMEVDSAYEHGYATGHEIDVSGANESQARQNTD